MMIKTVADLKAVLENIPDHIEVGFCSYNGGHMFEIGDSYLERLEDEGGQIFVLYTKKGEEAILRKI